MTCDPRISEWDNPAAIRRLSRAKCTGGERGELKHLSTRRKRKQLSDSPSSGERPGNSPNRRCHLWLRRGSRTEIEGHESERNRQEILAAEGDSPVCEAVMVPVGILSSAGHEKSCVNQPGPSGKAKYSCETDSVRVP